jgi:hypothetical protein
MDLFLNFLSSSGRFQQGMGNSRITTEAITIFNQLNGPLDLPGALDGSVSELLIELEKTNPLLFGAIKTLCKNKSPDEIAIAHRTLVTVCELLSIQKRLNKSKNKKGRITKKSVLRVLDQMHQ